MFLELNYKESLDRNKIVFQEPAFGKFIEVFFAILSIIILPLFAFTYFHGLFENGELSQKIISVIVIAILTISVSAILYSQIRNIFKFESFSGDSVENNRKLFELISKENGWVILRNNRKYMIILLPVTGFSWKKQISVIFNKNNILVNIMTFGLHDIKSPFHYYSTKAILEQIKSKFNQNSK